MRGANEPQHKEAGVALRVDDREGCDAPEEQGEEEAIN